MAMGCVKRLLATKCSTLSERSCPIEIVFFRLSNCAHPTDYLGKMGSRTKAGSALTDL